MIRRGCGSPKTRSLLMGRVQGVRRNPNATSTGTLSFRREKEVLKMDTTTANGHAKSGKTTLKVKAASHTEQPEEAFIEQIEIQTIPLRIVGMSQLIVNNFGSKGAEQMESDRARTAEEKHAAKKGGKPPITTAEIERRFQAARVLDSKGRDCVRAAWIKGALLSAGKYKEVGIPGTWLKGALFVEGDLLPITFTPRSAKDSDETITYFGKGPGQRRDVVRVGPFGRKQPDIRYRPCYDDWSIDFKITFEPKLISLAALGHLVRRAGMSVGLCEWRPEGPGGGKGGQFGRFDLDLKAVGK